MSLEEAKKAGAMALFSEKYGDVVRVVRVPGFSMELCAGSHVKNVGQIGMFKIVAETGVASGVRRIEAITGKAALDYANEKFAVLKKAAALLKAKEEDVPAAVEKLQAEHKEQAAKLAEVAAMQEKADAQQLIAGVKDVKGVSVVTGKANVENMDALREVADLTLGKLESGVVVLACVNDGKVNLVVKASKDAVKRGIHAGKIIKEAAAVVGGGGGGRRTWHRPAARTPKLCRRLSKRPLLSSKHSSAESVILCTRTSLNPEGGFMPEKTRLR